MILSPNFLKVKAQILFLQYNFFIAFYLFLSIYLYLFGISILFIFKVATDCFLFYLHMVKGQIVSTPVVIIFFYAYLINFDLILNYFIMNQYYFTIFILIVNQLIIIFQIIRIIAKYRKLMSVYFLLKNFFVFIWSKVPFSTMKDLVLFYRSFFFLQNNQTILFEVETVIIQISSFFFIFLNLKF